jgi:DNA-binding response OmpR family regulator
MRPNILVIEDDEAVRELLRASLEKENYRVHLASDGVAGLEIAAQVIPNLILLDWMLPKLSGIEVCKKLKAHSHLSQIPVIMLTARQEENDKVEGLDTGADDYMTKPFSPKELVARVRAQLRRNGKESPGSQVQYGDVLVNLLKREVLFEGKQVELTTTEFELLLYFMQNKGRVLTRQMILNHVCGTSYFGTTRTVDVHVTHLRRKISALADAITTVKPLGYKLKEL